MQLTNSHGSVSKSCASHVHIAIQVIDKIIFQVKNHCTVKPVCNDHPFNKIYYLWFIQYCVLMKTEGTNLLLLTISASWTSSRWPRATYMSPRRQKNIPLGGRYRQVSLYQFQKNFSIFRGHVNIPSETTPHRYISVRVCFNRCRHSVSVSWQAAKWNLYNTTRQRIVYGTRCLPCVII